MGRWQDGVSSSGVSGLLRRRCEEEPVADGAGAVLENSASPRMRPKGTYLQADFGCVQWEGEEVSKTGGCACPQELHSRCGRQLGRLQSNHGPRRLGTVPLGPGAGPRREAALQPWALVQGGGCRKQVRGGRWNVRQLAGPQAPLGPVPGGPL